MQPILKVDLTRRTTNVFTIPENWSRDYLGGASLAARLLYEQLVPEMDPLSPEAPLLFLNGPLSGTSGPAVGRFVVAGRSPATKIWGESNCGGFWGPELRKTGYDGLWISGRASSPVYIWIHGDAQGDVRVEIKDASHLWGLETYQTQTAIRNELGRAKPRLAVIGQAGEGQIPFASILVDHGRVAGRTGLGAVMGSKNLKAIALAGSGQIPIANPSTYQVLRSRANRALVDDPVSHALRSTGSASAADYFDYLGLMPKRYYQADVFEGSAEVSGVSLTESLLAGVSACHGCVIACGRVVRLAEAGNGELGSKRKGPEYETIAGFGPNLWIRDLDAITRLGELCDRYGMDSISLSNTIGLAFSLFEQGAISIGDTGGLVLPWGNAAVVEELVHLTARREGFGALLAQGAGALGRHFNREEDAVQVNGLEAAFHDPRGASGMALVYATSPRGACHNQSDYYLVEIGQAEAALGIQYLPRHEEEQKAFNVARHQDWRTVFNALVICIFSNIAPEELVALTNAASGLEWSLAELMLAGERAWNLKRVINNRLGLTRLNDRLPKAFTQPFPISDGRTEGYVPNFEQMLSTYYAVRGWDEHTGYPTRQKLGELGLDWVEMDLRENT